MPGVLGAPPGVTFSNTRSITTNGLTDDIGYIIPDDGPDLVNPKKRQNLHPHTNGLKNGLSSRGRDTGKDDDDNDEEAKARKKAEEEKKAEDEKKAKAAEEERIKIANENKAKEEAEARAKDANKDNPTKGKDDTTGHLLDYNAARDKVRLDLEDFKLSLDRILELLSSHVHPEDWASIFIHNQSARQFNASIGDRNETKLAPLRNAKGLVMNSNCTISELEGKSNAQKVDLLEQLSSQHKFEFSAIQQSTHEAGQSRRWASCELHSLSG